MTWCLLLRKYNTVVYVFALITIFNCNFFLFCKKKIKKIDDNFLDFNMREFEAGLYQFYRTNALTAKKNGGK